jgi:hypothetical protein
VRADRRSSRIRNCESARQVLRTPGTSFRNSGLKLDGQPIAALSCMKDHPTNESAHSISRIARCGSPMRSTFRVRNASLTNRVRLRGVSLFALLTERLTTSLRQMAHRAMPTSYQKWGSPFAKPRNRGPSSRRYEWDISTTVKSLQRAGWNRKPASCQRSSRRSSSTCDDASIAKKKDEAQTKPQASRRKSRQSKCQLATPTSTFNST